MKNNHKEAIRIVGAKSEFSQLEIEMAVQNPAKFVAAYRAAMPKTFTVRLVSVNDAIKIPCVKEIRAITRLGLKESVELYNTAPSTIAKGLTWDKANAITQQIGATGALVEMVEE
jgi:ribosomal protein L7/L12